MLLNPRLLKLILTASVPCLRSILLPLLMLPGTPDRALAQVYRCDLDGEVAFSDQPCRPGARATRKHYDTARASGLLDLQVTVTHYPVAGASYDALTRSLSANGPKGFHGLASWRTGYKFTTTRQADRCRIDTVTTHVRGEILMPRWVDETSAPRALQRRWTDYYAALKRHEDGHIQHGRELALLVKERLLGIGSVPCDEVQALAQGEFDRLYRNLKTRDQEYDARTGHGATQGAWFSPGDDVPGDR